MKKKFQLLSLILSLLPIYSHNSSAQFKTRQGYNETHNISSALFSTAFIYTAVQTYLKANGYAFSSQQDMQAHLQKMSFQEWKTFIETGLLKGKSIESLTFAEKQQLFKEFELYQYDGYRLFIASLPEFKNFVASNARYPSTELKKNYKNKILYSKHNLMLIRRYYNGEIKLSEQEINALPDTLTGENVETIIGKWIPKTIADFIHEEGSYKSDFSGLLDPRQTPFGLSPAQEQELVRNIKNNFGGTQSNIPAPQLAINTTNNIYVAPVLSQETIQMCEEKNIDINLIALSQGTTEQNVLHSQFVDIINKSANIYVRYENYSDVRKMALGATQYSLAGISLTKSNNMPLARAAYKVSSSIIALLEGVREACSDKLSQVSHAVRHPVQFGRDIVDLALNASSEIALFTTQALKDPQVQETIVKIIADPHPSFTISSIVATKVCKEVDMYLQTHTLEQAAHTLGKEMTDLIIDAIILNGIGRAAKTLKITKKLGYVGRQASKLVGFSLINKAESIEKAALILAEASPEALSINPIVRAAISAEIECAEALKQVGFKTLPKTVNPLVEELVAGNGLPKSFIPNQNSLTLTLQENGIYELNKSADIFGNNWKKIGEVGEEFWQITPASAKGREFLLQTEKGILQKIDSLPQNISSNNQLFLPATNYEVKRLTWLKSHGFALN